MIKNRKLSNEARTTIEFEGVSHKGCPHCKGKGWKKCYEHVQGGVCFQCDGWGSVEVFNIVWGRIEAKKNAKHIEWLNSEVKRLANDLINGTYSTPMRNHKQRTLDKHIADLEKEMA